MRPSNRSSAALVIAIRFKVTVIFTFASTPNSRTPLPRRTVASLGRCFNKAMDLVTLRDKTGFPATDRYGLLAQLNDHRKTSIRPGLPAKVTPTLERLPTG